MNKILEKIKFSKFGFMSYIGGLFIITFLLMTMYQQGQLNFFYAKGKLNEEVYERLITNNYKDLLEIVMIIVLFFFKSNVKENEPINNLSNESITDTTTTNI